MNLKMNFIESIFYELERGEDPEFLNGTYSGFTLYYEHEQRGETVRVYNNQYGRPICTIIKTATNRPYLNMIHESNGVVEKYSFSMGFNTESKRTDNSLKYYLFDKGETLVLKQSDAETHFIPDIHAEDSMFQFSTLYNADHDNMVLLDKAHKQLSAMELNNNYIFTGAVNALKLKHFF